MNDVLRLQLESAKLVQQMNDTLDTQSDTPEQRATMARLKDLNTKIITAREAELAAVSGANFDDSESSEVRSLVQQSSVERIVISALANRSVDGAEAELQAHYGLDSHSIPLRLLIPEQRDAASFGTTPATPGSSPGIAGQVFGDSASAFANVRFEDVPMGTRVYPVMTTGALGNVGTPAGSAAQAETDAVLAVTELKPKRVQVQLAYRLEDAATFGGVDAGFRENIRAGLRDKVDDQILNRGTDGLLTQGTAPTNPGSANTAAQYIAALYAGVDGRYAGNESEVKMLVGSAIYGHMAGLALATGDGRTVTDKMGARLRVSPNVPAYASNRQQAVVCKGLESQTVAAIWPGLEILEDRTSRAAEGEVRLIGVLLHDFAILRADGYTRHAFRNS